MTDKAQTMQAARGIWERYRLAVAEQMREAGIGGRETEMFRACERAVVAIEKEWTALATAAGPGAVELAMRVDGEPRPVLCSLRLFRVGSFESDAPVVLIRTRGGKKLWRSRVGFWLDAKTGAVCWQTNFCRLNSNGYFAVAWADRTGVSDDSFSRHNSAGRRA